jgi:hypothetical protein
MTLRDIPWFVEGSDCAMWRVNPDDYVPAHRPTVYVRLADVLELAPSLTLDKRLLEFISVGRGGPELVARAKELGWELFSTLFPRDARLVTGWTGDCPDSEYFIKKTA